MQPIVARTTFVLAICCAAAVANAAAGIDWEPYELESYHGKTRNGFIGRLTVPQSRVGEPSGTVELAVVRLPSTAEDPGPPIVYLAGGPGGSGISAGRIPGMFETFDALTGVADVILLDQRGSGRSRPRLFCPAEAMPPTELFADFDAMRRYVLGRIADCRKTLESEGIDLSAFNTLESAHDLDDLRRALGADMLSLLGFSYGTHLGLAAIRYHGATIHRAVLVGTEGPDHTRKLPSSLDTQFDKLSLLAADDPSIGELVPDMTALARSVLSKLAQEPVPVTIELPDGETVEIPVGRWFLEYILYRDLGDGNDFPVFPALLYTIDRGDTSMLAWFVRKRARELTAGISATLFAVDGASGASPERRRRIERETPGSLLGRVANLVSPETADAIGARDLGPGFRAPLVSDARVLFVSGSLDSNAPPYQAEEIRWGMPNAVHLVVTHAGHEDMLGTRLVGEVIVDWFEGNDVADRHLALPAPDFLSVSEAKRNRGVE